MAVLVVLILLSANLLINTDPSDSGNMIAGDGKIGTGDSNFWTTYPDSRPVPGSAVAHPTWLINEMSSGPVMLLVHQEGCAACAIQLPICLNVYESHSGNLTYLDILGGRDSQRLNDCIVTYDPDDGTHYVPLTILVTKMVDASGNTVIAWHSWEDVIKTTELTSWVEDAIDQWPVSG